MATGPLLWKFIVQVTVPLAAGNAPGLSKGQRVEVWLSTSTCTAVVLLGDVTVQGVTSSSTSGYVDSGGQNIVLTVAPDLAARVVQALAIENATIRAGVLSGPRRAGANDSLAPITTCTVSARSS